VIIVSFSVRIRGVDIDICKVIVCDIILIDGLLDLGVQLLKHEEVEVTFFFFSLVD